MRLERIDLVSVGVVAAMASTTALAWLQGPDGLVPAHIGLDGTVNRWAPSGEVAAVMALVTAIAAAVAGLMAWLKRHPHSAQQAARAPVGFLFGRIIGLAAPALAVGLMAAMILGGLRPGEDQTGMLRLICAGAALIFAVIGALLGKTPPNLFVGVRTPWSLTSRLAWDKSNRLAGRLLFWIGLAGLALAPIGPMPQTNAVLIAAVIAAAAWSIVESWRVWRLDPDRCRTGQSRGA